LASGVAHDFNNLLTVILGNITLAQMYSKPEGKVYQLLSESEKACNKAKELTDRLTAFSRRGDIPQKNIGDITEILKDVSNFVLMGSNVRSDFQPQKDLWMIEYDVDLIKQMITDIIINAKEAMPTGGKLKIISKNMTMRGRDATSVLKLQPGKYVKITFQDHGIGIASEHLSKVFDPYFSTKEQGIQKGMGLGLTSVYSIIKKHGGHIQIESSGDTGTTISVYMPAIEHKPLGSKAANTKDGVTRSKKGTILVMDDEAMVREVIGEMLRRLGYAVKFAHNGSEAVELYYKSKEFGTPFQAAILDLTIRGGMGGKETLKRLREIDPGIKAFASSGYTEDPAMTDFRKYGFSGVIAKPYGMENLSKILNKIL
jgi:CheY-like chemotaxis protein